MNIRRAAKKYGVPKSTLSDKVNKVNFISAFGKKPGIRQRPLRQSELIADTTEEVE